MINIAIVNANNFLRKGLYDLLSISSDFSIILETGNSEDFKMKLKSGLPNICLIDANLKDPKGYELAAYIKGAYPSVKILAVSIYHCESEIAKMLSAGANGYLLIDSVWEELANAIRIVCQSGFYYNSLVGEALLKQLHSLKNFEYLHLDLNDREVRFLKLCCKELTYSQIASEMYLSPRTIQGYRESLFKKLNVKTRTGLVMHAIKAGLVE